jgi:8-oxo-dGTP pyrophosphatase MutT (NUDIX family)
VTPGADWPSIEGARLQRVPRVPLRSSTNGAVIGRVARDHLPALRGWPRWVRVDDDAVTLRCEAGLDDALVDIHAALRDDGLIRAWRDEPFTLWQPHTMQPLATMERAAARFWGSLTLGAHANGYVADDRGRPVAMWIARRSPTKATDPGLHDNLVGGGVPRGQTPAEALVREGWEEAGLDAATMAAAVRGRTIRMARDIPEGFQFEDLHVWDLPLQPQVTPRNQDGEVAALQCLPIADALALAAGDSITVDAALVILDLALRHRLFDDATHARLEARAADLWHRGAGIQDA